MLLCGATSPPDLDKVEWRCRYDDGHKENHDWEGLSSDSSQRYFPPEVGRWDNTESVYEVDSIGNHYRNGKEVEVE